MFCERQRDRERDTEFAYLRPLLKPDSLDYAKRKSVCACRTRARTETDKYLTLFLLLISLFIFIY